MTHIEFNALPIGSLFSYNGNKYIKRSVRTAAILCPIEYKGTWFYFRKKDMVRVEQ